MLNLVSNAVKYTQEGQIKITIEWIENKTEVDDECFEPEPFSKLEEGSFEKAQ